MRLEYAYLEVSQYNPAKIVELLNSDEWRGWQVACFIPRTSYDTDLLLMMREKPAPLSALPLEQPI